MLRTNEEKERIENVENVKNIKWEREEIFANRFLGVGQYFAMYWNFF